MADDVIKKPLTTLLVEFPEATGGISMTEHYGKWNELTTPLYTFRVDTLQHGKAGGIIVESVPAMALAAAAFKILKAVRQHLPDEALERLFEKEIGPL